MSSTRTQANLLLFGQCTGMAVVALGPFFERHWRLSFDISFEAVKWAGICIFAIGAGIFAISAFNLGRSLTPDPIPKKTADLVVSGLYSYCRHPIYLALILASIGWALTFSSWISAIGAVDLILVLNSKAHFEESLLIDRYGDAYRQYMKKVARFYFPRLEVNSTESDFRACSRVFGHSPSLKPSQSP